MSGARMFFMMLYGLFAIIGLLMAAAARDIGISIFGWGLLLFGVLMVFHGIKAHFDELEGHR